jgi:hypothetical protein
LRKKKKACGRPTDLKNSHAPVARFYFEKFSAQGGQEENFQSRVHHVLW